MYDFYIKSEKDLVDALNEYGIVPFFKNEIKGFSISEHIDPRYWFGDVDGVWEWKGPVIRETKCAYGKFFKNKAVFISEKLFVEFSNFRRDGYDFDSRADDGLTSYREEKLYSLIAQREPVLSKTLKKEGNYSSDKNKGFDALITRLQMQSYIITSDFVYSYDKNGKRYGWGISEYSTPESFFGESYKNNLYSHTRDESYGIIFDWIINLFPGEDEKKIHKLLQYQ